MMRPGRWSPHPGRRMLAVLLATVAFAAVSSNQPADAATRTVTYDVGTRGSVSSDVGEFAQISDQTLRDGRGWSLGGSITFRPVQSGGQFHLQLASPAVIGAYSGCSANYSCRVGDQVLINDRRWRAATSSWTKSLADYRQYVVNHEVGHWLGLGHSRCPGRGQPAPVMQQQSISLQGCAANVWPLAAERDTVARRYGVAVRGGTSAGAGATPERAAAVRPDGADFRWLVSDGADQPHELRSFRWGRPTEQDVPVVGDWNGDGIDTAGVARPDGEDWLWLLTDQVDSPRLDHQLRWGRPSKGDVPVVGDWDGDGRATPAVVRPDADDLRWLATDALRAPRLAHAWSWGRPSKDDIPVAGDWDGDGRSTPGVARTDGSGLRWLTTRAPLQPYQDVRWGQPGDLPVPGDWDGDGVQTPGVVRSEEGDLRWLWTNRAQQPTAVADFRWGRPTTADLPVVGSWGPSRASASLRTAE